VGDRLLLIDEPMQGDPPNNQGKLLTLTTVELLTASGQTRIAWDHPLITVPRRPLLFAFRQQVALFGNLAPRWETLSAETKQRYSPVKGGSFRLTGTEWRSVTLGLPTLDVRCLAIKLPQFLFAGTLGGGIFRSLDWGESWQQMTIGLSNLAIETLYCSEQGQVFAGTPGGGVFRSRDNGETWTAINTGSVRVQATGPHSWESVNTALPNTVVRCLLAYTALTLFGSGTVSSDAEPNNQTIRGNQTQFWDELSVGEGITISSQTHQVTEIISDRELKTDQQWDPPVTNAGFTTTRFIATPGRDFLFAGTDDGVYRSSDQGQNWYSKGLATRSVRALLNLAQLKQGQGTLKSIPKENGKDQDLTKLQGDKTLFENPPSVGQAIRVDDIEYLITDIDVEQKTLTLYRPLTQALDTETAFVLVPSYLYAATEQGVYRSANHGNDWELVQNFTENTTCLATLLQPTEESSQQQNNYLFAGTANNGVYRYDDGSNRWEEKKYGLTQLDITTLAVQGTKLYAGTGSGKIFVSENYGGIWNECDQTPVSYTHLTLPTKA
jgi:photosystem II stability/assembly factor-like uncharacterized protein